MSGSTIAFELDIEIDNQYWLAVRRAVDSFTSSGIDTRFQTSSRFLHDHSLRL